jgi:hypothetical protein
MGLFVFFPAAFGYDFHLQNEFVCKLFWVFKTNWMFFKSQRNELQQTNTNKNQVQPVKQN